LTRRGELWRNLIKNLYYLFVPMNAITATIIIAMTRNQMIVFQKLPVFLLSISFSTVPLTKTLTKMLINRKAIAEITIFCVRKAEIIKDMAPTKIEIIIFFIIEKV